MSCNNCQNCACGNSPAAQSQNQVPSEAPTRDAILSCVRRILAQEFAVSLDSQVTQETRVADLGLDDVDLGDLVECLEDGYAVTLSGKERRDDTPVFELVDDVLGALKASGAKLAEIDVDIDVLPDDSSFGL